MNEKEVCGFRVLLLILFLLFFLTSIENASAREKTIYDGWLYTGNSSKTTAGESFTLFLDDSRTLASVKFGDGQVFLVRQNQSETKSGMTVSFLGTRLGYYDSHRPSSYGTYTQYDEAHIVISVEVANIDFKLELNKNEIEVGSTAIVNTTFLNNGTKTAENIVYIASFPSSVKIMNIQGCDFKGDYAEWKGSLLSYQKAGCSLALLALQPATISAIAVLNYSDGVSNISIAKNINLKVKDYSLDIKNQLNKYNKSMNAGDIVNLSINLTNIDPERDMEVDFSLSIAGGLQIIDKSATLSGNGWKGTLKSGTAPVQLYIMLRAVKSGIQEVKEKGIFKVGFTQTINEKIIQLNVSSKKLKTIYRIKNQTNETYVEVGLVNNESKLSFKNINASVIFSNNSYNFSIDMIEPGYYFSIFRKNFSLEDLNISNFISVKAYYSGFYGESFTINEIKNITAPLSAKSENKTTELNTTLNAASINLTNVTNINATANISNTTSNSNNTINTASNKTKALALGIAPKEGDFTKKLIAWFLVFLFLLFFIFLIMSFVKRKSINTKEL
ncbi:MAG: hypothetical protein Q7J54_00525 [Candidatus Woesearchaeota archaeon]|nr:hypothetical protein [Candidatus Woesearchaeota archaeon]